jgi:hypothetical protein
LGAGPAAWLSGVTCALSTFGVVCLLLRVKVSGRVLAVILVVCAGADIGLNLAAGAVDIPPWHLHAGINLALLGMAVCGGVLLSYLVEKKSYIIPLALAAGLADIWSVTLGVTREVIQSRTAMNHFLFHFPVIGRGVSPLIGAADFVLAAFFLSLAHRFHLPAKETGVALGAAFVVAITLAAVTGYGTPVLPVMGILFILVHYREIKVIDPGEKKETLIGLAAIILMLFVITLLKA